MAQVKAVPLTSTERDRDPIMLFSPLLDRMPLLQLRDLAAYPGWENLNAHHYNFLEFRMGLHEAALDGRIRFWGQRDSKFYPGMTIRTPLREIPKEHWCEFEIEILALALSANNIDVRTLARAGGGKLGYVDLRIEGNAARNWLRHEVNNYKGRRR